MACRVEAEKRIDPGDTLAIGKHKYELRYDPSAWRRRRPPAGRRRPQHLRQVAARGAGLSGRKEEDIPDEYRQDGDDADEDRPRGRSRR